MFAILHMMTEKPAALLAMKHAECAWESRGNGLWAAQELESNYLKSTNESVAFPSVE